VDECTPLVVGVLAMIDDGETDWKVFCLRVDDPLAPLIDTLEAGAYTHPLLSST